MNVNRLNRHDRDRLLDFDPENHAYYYDGRELKSVTTFVEECFPTFDKEYFASRVAAREGTDTATIIARWEENARKACELGTALHDKIERHYLGLDPGDPEEDAFPLFRRFAAVNSLTPYRTEWRIYHEGLDIAGTLDFLERTPDGTYNIYDWKRSSKVVGNDGAVIATDRFGKRGLPPIQNLPDTSYWHYALQLSIYRLILAERYDINVSRMFLGIFHPCYSTPWRLEVPYLSGELKRLFGR